MKKRVLSLVLALVLALSLTPAALAYDGQTSRIDRVSVTETQAPALTEVSPAVTGWEERVPFEEPAPAPGELHLYGATIDEDEVYRILNSLRSQYPEGMYWTNESQKYTLSVPVYDEKDGRSYYMTGYGCVAFCYRLSDAAFGSLSARAVYRFTYDDVHIGDVLRVENDTHSVIVLEKYSDHVVLAEGNYNSSVHWGRTMTRDQVMRANYIVTRYPAGASSGTPSEPSSGKPSNVKVSTDKTSYSIGETVTISYSADDADSFNISLWLGAYGTGTQVASQSGFTSGKATYQTEASGTYTLYVEAVNNYGTASATCQFSVSGGGKPTNVKVRTDKSSYAPGETVYMYFSADDAVSYNLSIWQGAYGSGTLIASGDDFTTGEAYYAVQDAGTYTLYVEAVNNYGTSSAACQFSISGGKPSNLKLTADRSIFVVGEPFYLTVTADDMTGYNAELWRGGYGTGTLIDSAEDFSPDERIEVTLASTDSYTIYVEAYNDYGKITATMSVRATDNANSGQFTDVPPNAYYAGAVDWAVNKGVTEGTGGNKFSPNSTVTRGQAVTFLWRAVGRPEPTSWYNPFTDVKSSDYYYQAVLWAVENGITDGVGNMRFNPGGSVTRGQMVTFLWRTMGRPGETGQGAWYADAEYWARTNSLLSGTAVGYTTNAACPRSDVVYYLWNALA